MIDPNTATVVVTVNVAPALEEPLVDWLLELELGFSSVNIHGHGTRHSELSVAEQVSGRQKRVEFRTEMAAGNVDGFLATLAAQFAGTDLYFFVTPVLRSGHLHKPIEGQVA
jgi:hypothetical protein